ncbi:HEAT repeat domain-containing protein [Paenibacillus mesophilus]|uniref:HEAT repeat domain-containing protein n=1 Tax=Paenibacillus mesophilus TaxID=2582849 RepID=UPI00110DF4A8|nr:HEAT repeat domain-containing protein [Paenibacillus mesophilus]TMV52341.1 HEAT repeat domain-containing protein [Paenibacillus mesophilus]
MSTALLQELMQEVRRLYIAGSELAAGDFRLKRLLPQFVQLGERAPVFKRLGEGIATLVEPHAGQTGTSAESLQELGLLLGSVLRTQGSVSPEGELKAIENRPVPLSTGLSYRKLAAVRTALTTTGGGRYEVIVQAFEAGMFRDLRLLPHAIAALDDPYVEVAEYAMSHILPSYGPSIVPLLSESFDPSGGKPETRKLQVIGAAGGDSAAEYINQAAETGSEEVRATAIGLLAGRERYVEALIGWTKDKKKAIREAAYLALAEGGSARAAERLYDAFSGKDIELAAEAARRCRANGLTESLVRDLDAELKHAAGLNDDEKKRAAAWSKIGHFMTALDGKQSEVLRDVYAYAADQYPLFVSYGWLDLIDAAASYFEQDDSEQALALLHELERQNVRYVPYAFRASFRLMEPAELYERYAGALISKWKLLQTNKDIAKRKQALFAAIQSIVITRDYREYPMLWSGTDETTTLSTVAMTPSEQLAELWDARWLDCFIEQNALELVCAFARPGHESCVKFLLGKLENNPEFRNPFAGMLLCGLERAGAREDVRQEALMKALEDKRNSNCYYFEGHVLEQLYRLPAQYRERLEAVLSKFNYTAGQQLRYVLETMQAAVS